MPGTNELTEHIYTCNMGCILDLGVDGSNTIKHMQLLIPHELIVDDKYRIPARDIVKSFVLAVPTTHLDDNELKQLADEIYVRDLDLHPVDVANKKYADTGRTISGNMYKIGAGPSKTGDRLLSIGKMPVLAPQASSMYDAFIGKKAHSGMVLSECRLKFENGKSNDKEVLLCEAWDEQFWQARNARPVKAKPRSTDMQTAVENARVFAKAGKFKDVIDLLKPMNNREPDDFDCLITLGEALEASGNHRDAQTILLNAERVASREGKDSANLHLILCKSLLATGAMTAAVDECRKAEKLAPDDAGLLMELGDALAQTGDPVLSNFAVIIFNKAEKLGLKNYRLAAMQALASYQMGQQKDGLRRLKESILSITADKTHEKFLQEMKNKAAEFSAKMQSRPKASVPAKERTYQMNSGTAAVVAESDETTGIVTFGIMGGHDPDGGKQDGCDDGIIQVDWHKITQPSEVYRPKQ